ncbi:MAG: hypothetical protein FJ278_05120 [Planctomycetes bacterium]|nr:hypothetical protein [Planctomycetota bacterium]
MIAATAREAQIRKAISGLDKNKEGEEGAKLQAELKDVRARMASLEKALKALWQQAIIWRTDSACFHSLILAGDALIAGGANEVAAFSAADGQKLWQSPVDGNAHGLAVASGSLLVSTDRGSIHCFRSRSRP